MAAACRNPTPVETSRCQPVSTMPVEHMYFVGYRQVVKGVPVENSTVILPGVRHGKR